MSSSSSGVDSSAATGTNAAGGRGASPNTVVEPPTEMSQVITALNNLTIKVDKMSEDIDKMSEDIEKEREENKKEREENKKFRKETTDNFERLNNTMARGSLAAVTGSPGMLLGLMPVPIVEERSQARIRRALEGTKGYADDTWTFVKHVDENETKTEYFAVSCAHCALLYQIDDGETPVQFVKVPAELLDYVSAVSLLKAGHCFGYKYQYARYADIVFLNLTELPDNVNEEHVPIWHDKQKMLHEQGRVRLVFGDNLKAPITGRNAVLHEKKQCWYFALDSTSEPGQSGTLMFGTDEKRGGTFLTATDKDEEAHFMPDILGVYTGIFRPDGGDLPSRGTICPLPAYNEVENKSLENLPLKTNPLGGNVPTPIFLKSEIQDGRLTSGKWRVSEWKKKEEDSRGNSRWVTKEFIYKLELVSQPKQDMSPNPTMRGVFIKAPIISGKDIEQSIRERKKKATNSGRDRVASRVVAYEVEEADEDDSVGSSHESMQDEPTAASDACCVLL